MTNILDQYAHGYQYLGPAVFFGTLTPYLSDTPISNVPYRHVSKERWPVDWEGNVGLSANQQAYELWTAPMGGYMPAVNDVWADQAGVLWNVLDTKSSDLVGSTAIPVNVLILAQRAK